MRTKVHLISGFAQTPVSDHRYPLYSDSVRAGFPSPAEDFLDTKLDLNQYLIQHPTATFFVRVSGNAMHRAGIVDGDLLVVDRSLQATDGSIVIAVIEGEMLVRRYKTVNNQVWLMADPRQEEPIVGTDQRDWQIWGVVTSVIHKTR